MTRRLLVTFAALSVCIGLTACGDDDDDATASGADTAEQTTTEATDPPFDEPAMSGATLAFCEDWNDASTGETPVS